MKTISELRGSVFKAEEVTTQVSYFVRACELDFDVFLPSLGINLQRKCVWKLFQKQELIWSILKNRYIPRLSFVRTSEGVFQVIDGKQRLSAMIDFCDGKFSIEIDGIHYFFKDLPVEYQRTIGGYQVRYCIKHEDYGETISDQCKIDWFLSINFSGTEQDKKHFERLKNKNNG